MSLKILVNGQCQLFTVVSTTPKQLTISYDPTVDNWVFFHSYHPNVYLRDRVQAYCADTTQFYKMSGGPRGTYMAGSTKTAFILDLAFKYGEEIIIDDVAWEAAINNLPFVGFTHVTVCTRDFCTGRIALSDKNTRKLSGNFSFNELRDIVKALPFRKDVFDDFDVLSTAIDANMAWWKKGLMQDNYCIVRLEYDGSDNMVFLGANTTISKTVR